MAELLRQIVTWGGMPEPVGAYLLGLAIGAVIAAVILFLPDIKGKGNG